MPTRQVRTINPRPVVTVDVHLGEGTPTGSARKVLLLEDRDDFRDVLRDYLVTRSYQVVAVNSGIEGLREIMNGFFDAILCDMLMPRMGGEMFYWAVTRVKPATRGRFIFFTGHKNNPAIDFFFRRVNARVLFKPFKLGTLDAVIRDVFRKVG